MSDQENKVPTPAGEDTQTRKTVKLKAPTTPSASIGGSPGGIADPLSGRDTDTGNLEVLSDTQTRKTVKLKPIAPGASPLSAGPAAAAAPGASDTNTRKVVVLKSTPEKNTPIDPVASAAPAPAADEDNDETVKVKKVEAPAMPADSFKDDATVKLKRPDNAIPGMRPPASAPAAAAPAAPAPALAPQATVAAPSGSSGQTIGIKKPAVVKKETPTAAAPDAPAAPAPQTAAPAAPAADEPKGKKKKEKPSLGMKNSEAPSGQPPMVADMANQLAGKKSSSGGPSSLYMVLAVLTVICLVATAAMTVVQYFNILEAQNIEIPFLSDQIK